MYIMEPDVDLIIFMPGEDQSATFAPNIPTYVEYIP